MIKKAISLAVLGLFAVGFLAGPGSAEETEKIVALNNNLVQTSMAYMTHGPIEILGNSQFVVGTRGVVGGTGTSGNPFIIQNWEINATTATGIWIENTTVHFTIRNCRIYDGFMTPSPLKYSAVYLKNVTSGEIINCNFINNYAGSQLFSTRAIVVLNNTMLENYMGCQIENSNTITFSENEILSCKNCGVAFFNSEYITISYNNITNSSTGINLYNATRNIIGYNDILDNTKSGATVSSSSNYNRFSFNNFFNNSGAGPIYDLAHAQANDSTGTNFWNTSKAGNFWSDWTGPDDDHDGFVDNPYVLKGSASPMDMHPIAKSVKIPEFSISPVTMLSVLLLTSLILLVKRRAR